ncbi:hypothetical protein BC628DRAFT_1380143 [Trametes gibbosa]|nr:hypothetical protein BC628DRAFT_1380143 [Trametes gibbosa]
MRTPSLACALFAAAAATLVGAAPHPAAGTYSSDVFAVSKANSQPASIEDHTAAPSHTRPRIGIKEIREAAPDHQPKLWTDRTIAPRALDADAVGGNAYYSGATKEISSDSLSNNAKSIALAKRTDDNGTLGGNAYTGNSGDVDGGDVVNQGNNFGAPTILNMNSNNAGSGGESMSGCAFGGRGNTDRGSGGNAYSGSSGTAEGGNVFNSGGMMNVDSNNAGTAGTSESGCASGGPVSDHA